LPYDFSVPAKIARWLAAALTSERESRGWSQAELARRAAVDPSHLSDLEHRRRAPGLETLEKLSEALGMEVSALLQTAERLRDRERRACRRN